MWQIALRKSAFLKTHVNVEKWTVYPPSALLPPPHHIYLSTQDNSHWKRDGVGTLKVGGGGEGVHVLWKKARESNE